MAYARKRIGPLSTIGTNLMKSGIAAGTISILDTIAGGPLVERVVFTEYHRDIPIRDDPGGVSGFTTRLTASQTSCLCPSHGQLQW